MALPRRGWCLLLLAPFLIVLAISLVEARFGVPPYEPLLAWSKGLWPVFNGTLANYATLVSDPLYREALRLVLTHRRAPRR